MAFEMISLCLLLLLVATPPAEAAFSRVAQWKLDVIEQTHAGSWCYRPGASPPLNHRCTNSTLKMLLGVHINNDHSAGLSIAYYDLGDGSILGGAGWRNWDAIALPVGVCMAGLVDGLDNIFSATCRFTTQDNDHDLPFAHAEECTTNRPQLRVIDGCYRPPPRRPWLRLDDSTTGVLTIIGLILALPVFGLYRRYRARHACQQGQINDGQALSLVVVGSSTVNDETRQDMSRQEPPRPER